MCPYTPVLARWRLHRVFACFWQWAGGGAACLCAATHCYTMTGGYSVEPFSLD